MIPAGVHGRTAGEPIARRATLSGCIPSASLRGSIARMTRASSMPEGSGSWTRMPWMDGSRFNASTASRTRASPASAGRLTCSEWKPASVQATVLLRT